MKLSVEERDRYIKGSNRTVNAASARHLRIGLGLAAIVLLLQFPLVSLFGWQQSTSGQSDEPDKFYREYAGLSDGQIASIHSGKAIAKIIESPTPDEVFVFGSVYINSTPDSYLKFASDIDQLRKLPDYLAIRKFSDPPQLSDLEGFTLDDDDIKELKNCKPDDCKVQLPAESMEEFQKQVNWSAPDVADQVNRLGQKMALEALQQYIHGGNEALGTYRDKKHPTAVAETFASLLSRSKALPVYLPDLDRYLLDYPAAPSGQFRSQFYWEKINFGLKPTLRIVQAIVFHGVGSTEPAYAIAVKQLYASHYFETALDLTVCVRSTAPGEHSFYLITLKGSQQAGLTGFKGGIVRHVAVDKTRSSLERALASIKQKLESQTQ